MPRPLWLYPANQTVTAALEQGVTHRPTGSCYTLGPTAEEAETRLPL